MNRSRNLKAVAAMLLAGLAISVVANAEEPAAPATAKACSVKSAHFYATTGHPTRMARTGVGMVWADNEVLWTIAADDAGMPASDRAWTVSEGRLVPWVEKGAACTPHEIHVGELAGQWVVYRANEAPFLPTPQNVIVTVDQRTARYHRTPPMLLAMQWRNRLARVLGQAVPENYMAAKAAALPASSGSAVAAYQYQAPVPPPPGFSAGTPMQGHCSTCGCTFCGPGGPANPGTPGGPACPVMPTPPAPLP
ncbi:MAG TPA: hypothetical protein VGM19_13955 [Armatimonadota bacterium]|jgi:hypothetical protein